MHTLARTRCRRLLLGAALVAAGLMSLAPAAAQPRFSFADTPGRLSRDVRPAHSALQLTLDPDAQQFSGELTITLSVARPVPALQLHAHQLEAKTAQLLGAPAAGAAGQPARTLAVQVDSDTQTWRLTPADGQPVPAGTHRLQLAYTGRVQTVDSGLFKAPHRAFGQPARMLATQLEAVYARLLFPGFDEPAFRSVYELTVRAPRGHEVLSNMPLAERRDDGPQVVHRFEPTPPMPSYLVAVAVGRFDVLEGRADGVPLRIFTAPGKRDLARYALRATEQLLPYYNAYFGVPYALPKLDQLAVPSGRTGAMEDWGLISYAESLLLFDPATSSPERQRRIFDIVAHEVGHQWFGNLVTAASWEEIWLNEAFATWVADKAMAHFNPDWQVPLRRRASIDSTLARDATPATRAIRSGAVPEDRVSDVFDDITYTKGGAVLSMLEQWIGPADFRTGLGAYMRAQRLSNATAGDLWFHIGQAAGRDVAAVAASWTDQPGFPLLSLASRCEGGQTRIDLRQQRFSTLGSARDQLWRVPLVIHHGGRDEVLLLDSATHSLSLPGCPDLPPLLNPSGEGFYRVAYAPAQQAALARAFTRLPPAARIGLLSDTLALAQAGQRPMADYLALLAALPQVQGTDKPALVNTARSGLQFLDKALAGTAQHGALRAAGSALLAPELAALGWAPKPGEDSETGALRRALITELAGLRHPATLAQAAALFDADESGRTALLPAVRASVIQAAARSADAHRFGQLLARLKATEREEDRWLYASALAGVADAGLAQQVLDLSLADWLSPTMATALPGMVARQGDHAELAYGHVLAHWPVLAERAGPVFGGPAWLLPGAAEGFNRGEDAQRLLRDQQRLAKGPGAATAAQVAAAIELRAAVRAREADHMAAALADLARRLAPP